MQTMKFDYDKKFDTLYVALGDRRNSYGDDSLNGVVLMRDIDTDDIRGITILKFLKKFETKSIPVLPNGLNRLIEKDIAPLVQAEG